MKKIINIIIVFFLSSGYLIAESKEYRIGIAYGFTGAAKNWSEYARMGMELAADEINGKKPQNTFKLKLLFEDTQTEPKGAISAYQKLTSINNLDFFVGDIWSFTTEPVIPLTKRNGIPHLASVVPWTISSPSDNFFTFGQNLESAKKAVEKFFKINKQIKSVAIFCWDSSWGTPYLKLWKETAKNYNTKIIEEVCVNDFAYDYRTDVARIANKKPDAVIIAHHSERILKRMSELNFHPIVLSTSNIVEPIATGALPKKFAKGVYYTDWIPNSEFTDKFKKKFGKPPLFEAHNHYEIIRAIALAIQANKKNLFEGLRDVNYSGVAGSIDFRSGFAVQKGQASLIQIDSNGLRQIG